MTFKPAIWYPIALLLSLANLVSVWFAAEPAEPWHATIHAALALAFGLWAQRLRRGSAASELQDRADALEVLQVEMSDLRRELDDARARVDFAERLLEQRPEAQRMDPQQH